MAKIIVVDDNRPTGMYLKRVLEAEGRRVTLVAGVEDAAASFRRNDAHLVMINQTCGQGDGWTLFNRLKTNHDHVPVIVYLLDDFRQVSTRWIIQAVNEALSCLQKIPSSRAAAVPF